MTSKYGKNRKVANEPLGECVTDVLLHVETSLLFSITERTHGKLEFVGVIL